MGLMLTSVAFKLDKSTSLNKVLGWDQCLGVALWPQSNGGDAQDSRWTDVKNTSHLCETYWDWQRSCQSVTNTHSLHFNCLTMVLFVRRLLGQSRITYYTWYTMKFALCIGPTHCWGAVGSGREPDPDLRRHIWSRTLTGYSPGTCFWW